MAYKNPHSEEVKEKRRQQARRYYEKNRQKAIASVLASRAKNPQSYKRAQAKFVKRHPGYFHEKGVERYAEQKDAIKENRRIYYTEHREESKEYARNYYAENRKEILDKQKENQKRKDYAKKFYRELKTRVIAAYGGQCQCCQEQHFEFLTIDHINGGGSKHRKSRGAGAGFYAMLEKQGFPKDEYRLLCMNCNFALGIYDHCPHKKTY